MKKTTLKLPLGTGTTTFQLPLGSKILSCREQRGVPCMWVLVDADAQTESRTFTIYGTGRGMPEDPGVYIGTVFTGGGVFVWHIFEEIKQ